MKRSLSVLILVVLLLSPVIINDYASADTNGLDIAASPSVAEQVVNPNSSSSFSINLTNLSGSPLPLYVSAAPYDIDGYNDKSSVNWFKFTEPDLLILPGQALSETVDVKVPPHVEAGSHYASINFTPLVPIDTLKEKSAAVVLRISVTAVIIVNGKIIENATLGKISSQMRATGGPVTLSVPVHNIGNVHLLPHGMLNIYKNKRLVKSFSLEDQVIFPKSSYIYKETWNRHAWLGSYQAQAYLTYGSANRQLASNILKVSVTPWLLFYLIAAALVVVLLLYKFTRHRWKRAIKAILFES